MNFFTSDHHFGHKNIIEYCQRPFRNVKGMNEGLIRRWNEVVSDSDTVYHLGDLSFVNNEWTDSFLRKLRGTIVLVKGNHDRNWTSARLSGIVMELNLEIEGTLIHMSHKPKDEWHFQSQGAWHLHGHTHGGVGHGGYDQIPYRCDVGVDVWNYRPVSFERLKYHFHNQVTKPEAPASNG